MRKKTSKKVISIMMIALLLMGTLGQVSATVLPVSLTESAITYSVIDDQNAAIANANVASDEIYNLSKYAEGKEQTVNLSAPVVDGYNFVEWTSENPNVTFNAETSVAAIMTVSAAATGDLNIVANYIKVADNTPKTEESNSEKKTRDIDAKNVTFNYFGGVKEIYQDLDGQITASEIETITSAAAAGWNNGQVFVGWGTTAGDPQSIIEFPYSISGDIALYGIYLSPSPSAYFKSIVTSVEKVGDNVLSADTKSETITYKITINEDLPESVKDGITVVNTTLTQKWITQNNTKDEDGNWIVTFTATDGGQGQSLSPQLNLTTPYRTDKFAGPNMPLSFSEDIYAEPVVLSAKFNTDEQKFEITYANGDNTNVVGKIHVYSGATKDYVELENSEFNFTKNGDVWTASLDPMANYTSYRFSAQADEDTEAYMMDTTVYAFPVGINDPETGETIKTIYGPAGSNAATASKQIFSRLPSTQEEYEAMFGKLPEGATFGNIYGYDNEVDWIYKSLSTGMYMPVATITEFYAVWKYGEQVVYPYISYEVHFDVNDNGTVEDGELLNTFYSGSNRSAVNIYKVPDLPENTRTHEYKWEDEEGNQYTASQVSSVDFVGERTTLKPVEIVKENPSDFEAIEFDKIFDNTPLVVTNDGSSENDIITAFKAANPEIAKEAGNDLAIEISKPEDVNYGEDTYTYKVENVKWKDYENRNADSLIASDIDSYVMNYNVIIGEENGEKIYATNAQGEKLEGVVEMTIYPSLVHANAGSFVTVQGSNFMTDQSAYEGYGYRMKQVSGNWVGFIADSELAGYYSRNYETTNDYKPFYELDDYDQSPIGGSTEWASPSITLQHPTEKPVNELTSAESGQLAQFVYPDSINMQNYFVKESVNPMYIIAAEDFADEKAYDGQEYTITAEELMAKEEVSVAIDAMRDSIIKSGYEDQYDVSLFFWNEEENAFTATEYTTPSANVGTYEVPYKILFTDKEGKLLEEEIEEIGNQVNAYTATIDINPIPITITAADYSKTAGAADPVNFNGATLTAGTMVGSETFDVTVTRTGSTSQAAGTYAGVLEPSAVENGSALVSNYDITYVNGDYTIIPAPVVIVPPTPPVVVPPTPVVPPAVVAVPPVATPLADGPAETIIEDGEVPQAQGIGGAWSLVDLILTIVTTIMSIIMIIGYFHKKKEEDDEESEVKRKGAFRLFSVVPAIAAVILFIITQDLTQPMILIDQWTLLFAVITLVQVLTSVFAKKKVKEFDDTATV